MMGIRAGGRAAAVSIRRINTAWFFIISFLTGVAAFTTFTMAAMAGFYAPSPLTRVGWILALVIAALWLPFAWVWVGRKQQE